MLADRHEKRRRMLADDITTSSPDAPTTGIPHQACLGSTMPITPSVPCRHENSVATWGMTKKMCLGNTTKHTPFSWVPSFESIALDTSLNVNFPPIATADCVSNNGLCRCPCSPLAAQWGAVQLPTPKTASHGVHGALLSSSWGYNSSCSSPCCSRQPNSSLGSTCNNFVLGCVPVVFQAPVNCYVAAATPIGVAAPYRPSHLSGGILLQEATTTQSTNLCGPCQRNRHGETSEGVRVDGSKGGKRTCLSEHRKDVNENVTDFSVPSPSAPIAAVPLSVNSSLEELDQDHERCTSNGNVRDGFAQVLLRRCSANYGAVVPDDFPLRSAFLRPDAGPNDERQLTQRVPDWMERVPNDGFSRNLDFLRLVDTAEQLRQCFFYYEGLDWKESVRLLQKTEFGTFLVRDSSDPRYLYALSVQTERGPTSVRLQYSEGKFRLDAEPRLIPRMPLFDSVLALVDYYVEQTPSIHDKGQVWLDHHGQLYSPILLREPLRKQVPSLQHMSRLACNRHPVMDRVKWHKTNAIPVTLVNYLHQYPFKH